MEIFGYPVARIIFLAVSLLTLASALAVVLDRNLFHAALAMMVTFLGVAGLYVTLDAGFLAAAQLMIYIGAISILIIFAIMLTRRMMQAQEAPFNSQPGLGLFTAVSSFILITAVITRYWPTTPDANVLLATKTEVPASVLQQSITTLGEALVSSTGINAYVLPFEITSVLLLAALIGSIIIAWPREGGEV